MQKQENNGTFISDFYKMKTEINVIKELILPKRMQDDLYLSL